MKRLGLSAVLLGILTTTAFAAPLFNQVNTITRPVLAQHVRIICEQNGVCYRAPGPRPEARWIYGDGAFYGPYDGPRYYGAPNRRYAWSIFSPWTW